MLVWVYQYASLPCLLFLCFKHMPHLSTVYLQSQAVMLLFEAHLICTHLPHWSAVEDILWSCLVSLLLVHGFPALSEFWWKSRTHVLGRSGSGIVVITWTFRRWWSAHRWEKFDKTRQWVRLRYGECGTCVGCRMNDDFKIQCSSQNPQNWWL